MHKMIHGIGGICSVGVLLVAALFSGPARSADGDKTAAEKPRRQALYDPKADARAQLEVATTRARHAHARVLLMFGFNSCGWCHKLHGLLADNPELRHLVRDEYVLVMVDIGAPHAAELLRDCKKALSPQERQKAVGYPFLAVFDAAGKIVTAQRTEPLEEGDHHDAKRVKQFLERWVAPRQDARPFLDSVLARAVTGDKRVFLHFGAPGCVWCRRLDAFLERPEIAAILSRDFLDASIDIDRMKHGKDVLATYRKGDDGGIPWFVILDAKGKVLATSDGPKGNIGYPAAPHEIDHFVAILRKTARRIEPAQMDQVEAMLRKAAK